MIKLRKQTAVMFIVHLLRSKFSQDPKEFERIKKCVVAAFIKPVAIETLHPIIQWWVMMENKKKNPVVKNGVVLV